MKRNTKKNGFIAISMIYSVFILFVTILIAVMFSYITDRKSSNAIKQDIKSRFSAKLPEVIYTNIDNGGSNTINVQVNLKRGSFPVGTSKYVWSKNQNAVPNKIVGNGEIVSLSYDEEPGNYYLITQVCDVFDNCTVTISTKYIIEESATLIPGTQFNNKLVSLANAAAGGAGNIISFRRSIEIDDSYKTDDNLISISTAKNSVYAYCTLRTGSGVDCYYYTDAMRVKFNSDSSGMFRNMSSLVTVDLSDFDKSALTGVSNFFTGCTSLENIRTPIKYDAAPTIVLPDIFYNDESIPFNQILGSTKSKMWLTKGLVNYTIEYNLDGGELQVDNPVSYNRNSKTIVLNNPTKEGYVFAGWSRGKNLVSYSKAGLYDGVVMYADSIIFDKGEVLNNSANGIKMFAIKNNDSSTISYILNLSSQASTGHQEASFTYNNTTANRVLLKIASDASEPIMELSNLYWLSGRTYVVSFDVDEYSANRTYAKISNLQIELGSRSTPFEEYADKEMNVIIPHGSQGNRHYIANWIPVSESKYNLDIDPNGGKWYGFKDRVTKRLSYSEAFDIPIPTKDGYLFSGWNELNSVLSVSNGIDTALAYDNYSNNVVSIERVAKSQDNPISSAEKELKITNSGSAKSFPGLGGFINYVTPQNNHTYVHVFVAKLPTGYYFHNAYNSLGTGGTTQWLTSQAGTGKFQTYAYKVTTGTGSLGTFGHVYMSTSLSNTYDVAIAGQGAVTSYIASSNIYDITTNSDGIGQLDGTAKLTAKWETPKTLTINPNGGTYKGNSSSSVIKGVTNQQVEVSNNLSRPGYIFTGWTYSGNLNLKYYLDYYNYNEKNSFMNVKKYFNSATSEVPIVYDNNQGSEGTTKYVSVSMDSGVTGADGGYALKIATDVPSNISSSAPATPSPGAGGIRYLSDFTSNQPDAINLIYIRAKIPTGYDLKVTAVGTVYTGIGSNYNFVNNDNQGTGNWKTYVFAIYNGHNGSISDKNTVGYFYVDGGTDAKNKKVTWYVDYIYNYAFTKDKLSSLFKFENSNATLTARWGRAGTLIKFNPNGGTFDTTKVKAWTNGYYSDNMNNFYRILNYDQSYASSQRPADSNYSWIPDKRVIRKECNTFTGWYTAASGGTKVFDVDGSLVANVSGISDANSKWIKYGADLTLYAHWTTATCYNVNFLAYVEGLNIGSGSDYTHVASYNGSQNVDTVSRKFVQGEYMGPLPTLTRSGCTFLGWYPIQSRGTLTLDAGTSNYKYTKIKENLLPGATYNVSIEKATKNSGTATKFTTSVYDFTDSKSIASYQTSFGNNVKYDVTVPATANMSHNIQIIIYAGLIGLTSGNKTTYENVRVGTVPDASVTGTKLTDLTTFQANRITQYIPSFSCS